MNTEADQRKERRTAIVQLLTGPDSAKSVAEILQQLRNTRRVPETTVRRDLQRLIEQGRIRPAGVAERGARCYVAVVQ